MTPAVWVAIITTGGIVIGAFLTFLRRVLPPKRATAMTDVWAEMRKLRNDMVEQGKKIDALSEERDELRTTSRIMSDAYDALTAAVARTIPPIEFTAGERDAIERARSRRDDDDHMWPTQGSTAER
jgi:hypothetical protein